MKRHALVVAALLAAVPTLAAQEEQKKPPTPPTGGQAGQQAPAQPTAQPSPKTKEHDALKTFAGNWEIAMKMTPPGGDKPVESKAIARAELICDGLWMKSVMEGECDGQPMHAVWLLGYDPYKKAYRGICADNQEPSPGTMDARYDEKTRTWEFTGSSAKGQFKSTCVIKDADTIAETVTCTEGGKETKIEITHKRAKTPLTAEASAKSGKAPSKEHEELLKTVGAWDAVLTMTPTGSKEPVGSKGNEVVTSICDGRYIWTDFRMQWEGKPFEGHALMGYDTAQKKYVSYWLESLSPTVSESSGTFDAATKEVTLNGTSRDQKGKPTTTKETCMWKDDDTRIMKMECKGEEEQSFTITFKRRK